MMRQIEDNSFEKKANKAIEAQHMYKHREKSAGWMDAKRQGSVNRSHMCKE